MSHLVIRARVEVSPHRRDTVQTMFTSSADVFRTRQALGDLAEALRSHSAAVVRLGTTDHERSAIHRIVATGCRIDGGQDRVYTQLLLSAAMPDEDFLGFAVATAILLMDRLQEGVGGDDLFWNWDAFRDHYRLAEPPFRAALMNGFRIAEASGRVSLESSPEGSDCLTRPSSEVVSLLRSTGQPQLAKAIEDNVSAKEAGRIWSETAKDALTWKVCAGFRYLYERPASMTPPDAENTALIPWT